jgi:hypothetical protein
MLETKCFGDAEHCERMAAIMLTKGQRESYLELASQWRKLATEASSHRLRVEAWTRRTARPALTTLEPFDGGVELELAMETD